MARFARNILKDLLRNGNWPTPRTFLKPSEGATRQGCVCLCRPWTRHEGVPREHQVFTWTKTEAILGSRTALTKLPLLLGSFQEGHPTTATVHNLLGSLDLCQLSRALSPVTWAFVRDFPSVVCSLAACLLWLDNFYSRLEFRLGVSPLKKLLISL